MNGGRKILNRKKTARQQAVDMILADNRLTGEQKARKISNLIKLTKGK